MKMAEHYRMNLSPEDTWFNLYLPTDTPLCVDPFLMWADTDDLWLGVHEHILDFFEVVFDLVRESGGNRDSLAWKKAQALLMFPEPAEFCLGMANGSPNGSGTGRGLQDGMLEGVRTALGLGYDNVPHMEMLALFQGGVGLDRMSDAVCNIAKSYFIRYTQAIARRHGLTMQTFRVRNAAWDPIHAVWLSQEVELPPNPYLDRPGPVLLTPERFLKDIPVVTANGFWSYAWRNHSDELRANFNYAIARHVDAKQKAKLARQNPDIVAEFLTVLEHEDHEPYDVKKDPKLRTNWWELGGAIASRTPVSYVPDELGDFPAFVGAVIDVFRHGIEHQDDWQQLWYQGFPLAEKKVQTVFRSCAKHYCKANNVALIGEANAGRGPVDFEFARGWTARTVVEMKLVSNSKFWDGIIEQTTEYAIAADVNVAYFVGVAYTDAEMAESLINKVDRAAEIATKRHNIEVRAIVIDARQKKSASKLRSPKEVRDELHRAALPEPPNSELANFDPPDQDGHADGNVA